MFRPLRQKTTAALSSAALLTALCFTPPASAQNDLPQALQMVPGEAQVVVVIPSLQGLSDKIAQFSQNIGVQAPQTQDVLSMFKAQMGLDQGINDQGAMVMVVSDLATALQTGEEPNYAILVPVTDFQAFVQSFDGQQAEGELYELTMPDGPGYAKQLQGYAVISPRMESVQNYAAAGDASPIAQKLGTLGQRYLSEGDLSVYVDMAALGETLKPMLDQQMEQMTMMAQMMGGQNSMQAQNMQNLMGLYAVLGDAMVDSKAIVKSISLTGDAANLNFAINGKPDSAFTKLLPGGNAQPQAMLQALPSKPYIFAGAVDTQVINLGELFKNFAQNIDDDSPMAKLNAQMQPMIEQTQAYGMAFYAPTDPMAMMSGGLMNIVNVYKVQDPKQYRQLIKDYLQAFDGMEQPMDGMMADDQGNVPAISWTTQWADSEMQIQGADVDSFTVQTNFPPELMNQMGQMGPMIAALGGTGYSGFVATTDDHVIMTTVRDPQLMTAALQTVKGGNGLGQGELMQVKRDQALPPSPFAEGHFSVAGLATAVNPFMAMQGAQPINVPANLPPISMGAGLQETSLGLKLHVPAPAVKFIVDTAMQMQQQFQPQGGGFGPPPAPAY